MGKFSTRAQTRTTRQTSPVRGVMEPTVRTYNGAVGSTRDAQSELFLLAVTDFVSEGSFYESAQARDSRLVALIASVTKTDPDWVARFAKWLRSEANMRSASVVVACEYVRAGGPNGREVIDSVIQRADEPSEVLSYWVSTYGRKIPQPVKRGVADAVRRVYNERAALKYDTASQNMRFADVLQLVHPKPVAPWQATLFKYTLDSRYGSPQNFEGLQVITDRHTLEQLPVAQRREFITRPGSAEFLNGAGLTWEALAGWLQGPMDAVAWEAIIPSMGYMALLRNLRNFDQAGVSDTVAATVAAKLADPEQVAKSRQLPMRFMSAYRNAPSLRWAWALEKALDSSLANVPELSGSTLIMVDTSGSMTYPLSGKSDLRRHDAAVVFGLGLARRCERADVVSYSNYTKVFTPTPGGSLLSDINRWAQTGYNMGSGTATAASTALHFSGHNRVVILTDEQANSHWGGSVSDVVPKTTPLYTWNLAGERVGHGESGTRNRWTFGGLTDKGFDMIPLLERGGRADWPF